MLSRQHFFPHCGLIISVFYFYCPTRKYTCLIKQRLSVLCPVLALIIYSKESAHKQKGCTTWWITGHYPLLRTTRPCRQTQITRFVVPLRLIIWLGKKRKELVAFAFIVCGHVCSLPEVKQGSTDLEVELNKTNLRSEYCFQNPACDSVFRRLSVGANANLTGLGLSPRDGRN